MRRKILQIVFVIVLIFSFSQNFAASSAADFSLKIGGRCAAPGTPREGLKQATAVFLGEITKVSEADDTKTIEFRVEKFWKGAKRKTQTVSVASGLRYSPSFKVGERYLVYAGGSEGTLTTGRCSRTKLSEYADDDLKALGAGKKP